MIENIGLQDIYLDVSTKLRQKTFYANEVDTNGRGLHAYLQDNGVKVDGTGVTMRLRYKSLNDGESKTWDFTPIGDLTNGEFEFHYPTEMVRGHGNKLFPCTIVASNPTSDLAFENIFVYVNKAEVNTEGVEASNEHSTLRKSLDDVLVVQEQLANITPEQITQVTTAETNRVTAETTRGNSETSRANAESGRVTAEGLRVTAESSRATAEDLRATAEATREANDLARGTYVEAIEANYAPELATVKSQLADKATKAEFDAVVANVTVDSEVILARGTDTTLQNRIDKIENGVNQSKAHTHRILLVNPLGENYSCLIGGEDAYNGGYTVECCSWDAFVIHANDWKNQVDVAVFFSMNILQGSNVTGAEVETAMLSYKAAGTKFIFTNVYNAKLRKYAPDATFVETNIGVSVLNGLSLSTSGAVTGGAFVHDVAYPFTEEIIRPGISGPTTTVYSYQSTDPLTVFPVKAVLGEITVKCTAYKPGVYFAQAYAGEISSDAANGAHYKYIMLDKVIDALLGKTTRTRLAMDCQDGKKIAASGFDGDTTTDMVAARTLADAIGTKMPIGFSLYANKMTPMLSGFYRGIPGRVSLVSHTNSHFNTRDTITDEVHTIGTDQLVRLFRPYRAQITSVKSIDGTVTYTFQNALWGQQSPVGINYFGDTITTSPIELLHGVLKFAPDKIGQQVKISYTCIQDEYKEIIGSLDTLKSVGAITDKAVYLTGGWNGTHPYTALMAEKEGVTLCDHQNGANYNKSMYYARLRTDKFTIPVASMFKYDSSAVIRDTTLFLNTKTYNKATLIPQAIAYCKQYDLPYEWYDHDFMSSETDANGVWANTTSRWNADWKKATYEETRVYVAEMYNYLYNTVNAEGVVWMPREDCVRRLDYINKYIEYDVTVVGGKTGITVTNTGDKQVNGISFRIPKALAPTSVKWMKNGALPYTYANQICMTWLNLSAGATEVIEVI